MKFRYTIEVDFLNDDNVMDNVRALKELIKVPVRKDMRILSLNVKELRDKK